MTVVIFAAGFLTGSVATVLFVAWLLGGVDR